MAAGVPAASGLRSLQCMHSPPLAVQAAHLRWIMVVAGRQLLVRDASSELTVRLPAARCRARMSAPGPGGSSLGPNSRGRPAARCAPLSLDDLVGTGAAI